MSIYPILEGQVAHEAVIPPHHASPRTTKIPANEEGGDLIDFGQNDNDNHTPAPAPVQTGPPSTKTARHPSSDIINMLEATGQKADGPLLDFSGDLKENLPSAKTNNAPSSMKRADTEESNDAFFDAEE